jgi:hypothetical protein
MQLSPVDAGPRARHGATAISLAVTLFLVLAAALAFPGPVQGAAAPDGPDATWVETGFPSRFGGLSAIDVRGDMAVSVGFKVVKRVRFMPLAAVWDGTRWTRQPVRLGLGSADIQLDDVDLQSPHRGWLVGNSISAGGANAVAAVWNGTHWRGTPTDQLVSDVGFHGVAALGRRDVWAVGQQQAGATLVPALAHWDGVTWTSTLTPPLEDVGDLTSLSSVTKESPTTLWAVGSGGVALHYDGATWSQVEVPRVDGYRPELQAVRSFGTDDAWAVGYLLADSGARNPVALHWNGRDWQVAQTPRDLAQLNDVTRSAHGGTVAVGYAESGGSTRFYGLRLSLDQVAVPLELPRGKDALFGTDAGRDGSLWVVGTGAAGEGNLAPFAAVRH